MSFEVWGPRPQNVELVVDGATTAMVRDDDGWWHPADPVPWRPGVDYGYRVDGGEPVPDPRSRRQPHGVHGLSRTFDTAEYAWTDTAWAGRELRGAVIYELHVGTFAGTLDGAIGRLDHLVDLGITHVELLPVNAVNGEHNWGYDGVLWFAVHEPYGGPAAYQRFVDACHTRGLAVIQDVVYNHLGPSGNYLPLFGPYLGSAANSWGDTINLDGDDSDEVRRYIIDNATMWLRDFHVDGLRLDAVHALLDSGEVHLLTELSAVTDALALELGRPLSLIAESDLNDPRMISPRGIGGYGMTAQWDDDYHHAVHVALTDETSGYYADFESLGALAKVLRGGFFHDGTYSIFRSRNHGVPIDTAAVPSWRLVTFTQDHDQVGNRAAGDRPSQYLDASSLAIEGVLAVLTPFTPMLFMGQEWGASTPWQFFTSHPEPELGRAVSKGRLAEFASHGWDSAAVPDPQDPATFERSRLDWRELDAPPHAALLDTYRRLIRLRANHPEFADSAFPADVSYSDADRWIRYRVGGLTVIVNLGTSPLSLPTTQTELLFATREGAVVDGSEAIIPPRTAIVLAG